MASLDAGRQPRTDSRASRGRVLLVEDDPAISRMTCLALERAGFDVAAARTGEAALAALAATDSTGNDRAGAPDLVVLDIGLPGLDGLEVCRRMRAAGDWRPVLFLTARDDEVDRVLGLELGGDDYVTKPFSPRDLATRVGAHLRRDRIGARGPAEGPPAGAGTATLRVGPVVVDRRTRDVTVDGRPVELTTLEFDLLSYLAASAGQVFSREQLLDAVWGFDRQSGPRTVDMHVAQLRGKLGDDRLIRTIRGVGYALRSAAGG